MAETSSAGRNTVLVGTLSPYVPALGYTVAMPEVVVQAEGAGLDYSPHAQQHHSVPHDTPRQVVSLL